MQVAVEAKALSEAARSALMAFRSSRVGELIPAGTSGMVSAELLEGGFVGRDSGLTRAGSMGRDALLADALDKAFG
jgi:hypothetical protein